ncbi:MAG: glycosyltransferase family 2 protein [Caldilineaceae bacterium]
MTIALEHAKPFVATVQPTTKAKAAPLTDDRARLSIITPAYNEADNLPLLYERLYQVCTSAAIDWEWIIVDDHSTDNTFKVITELAAANPRIQALRFARNFGSHTAIRCGMQHAWGDCAVIMAADLQDPPETLPMLLAKWRQGDQVVWAVRDAREGESVGTVGFARLYYFLMRRVLGLKEMPASGADFFLLDRRVIDALCQFNESNVSLMALITWMGFRQGQIIYDKQARLHGQSGWNLHKKLKLVVDSITSFSYLPIRLMTYVGFLVALAGFLYAGLVVVNAVTGHPTEGWSSLMVVVLVVGGLQDVDDGRAWRISLAGTR